jgi:uncharacterized membrane protein YebE (DUF533 family)
MFDPQKILQQFLGGDDKSGERKDQTSPSAIDKVKWVTIGGLSGLLWISKDVRKLGGSISKIGGVTFVVSLAFRARKNWQTQQGTKSPEPIEMEVKAAMVPA